MKFLAQLFGQSTPAAANTLADARTQLASAKTNAEAVAALFTAAALDLDVLLAAGPESLKARLAEASAVIPAATAEEITGLRSQLETATTAKTKAESDLAAANGAKAKAESDLTAFNSALSASGVKADKPEDLGAAITDRISTKARELVAATGGLPLEDSPASDVTKPGAVTPPKPTGMALVRASIAAGLATVKSARN